MLSMELQNLITPGLGIVIGILMGLTGAGGGIVSVPLLIFVLHLTIAQAGPIALMAIASASSVGAVLAHRMKTLRYKAATLMAICGLVTAPLGLFLAFRVPNKPLTILFSIILILVSLRSFLQARQELLGLSPIQIRHPPCALDPVTGKFKWTAACLWVMIVIGSIAGFLSGLLGVGGGFVIVPALKKFTNLTQTSIISTSLGVMALISLGSIGMSAVAGTLLWKTGLLFSGGAVLGLLLGRRFHHYLNPSRSQQAFAILTFLIAAYLLIHSF
jgi:hypothetical protein